MALYQQLFGIGAQSINWYQAAVRAAVVYIVTLIMVRIGERRFLGKNTAFDIILGVILGSLVSSAINNLTTIWPTIIAGFVLMGLHWVFAMITYKWNILDHALKGTTIPLIKDGNILWDKLKQNFITREDLMQEVRTVAHTEDVKTVNKAFFERSGDVSVIQYPKPPRVLEVKVEAGVQTVRIVIE